MWYYRINMATSKVTFTLDQMTVSLLDQSAAQLAIPKSQVVSRAIRDFHDRRGNLTRPAERLSEPERLRLLKVIDEMTRRAPSRPQAEVDRELKEIRAARRRGGRRTRAD
jgi:predicted transcriptional regulator